ncbi:hypothetical protein Q3G72_014984 [Acer saccharum]|nr:hypothetical protein Q3G72_014984 [Acer saccharum]
MVHIFSGISRSICLAEGSTKGFSKAEILEVVDYDEPKPSLRIEYDAKAFDWGYIDSFMMREEEEELQQQELPCRVQYLVLKGCKYPVKLEQVLQSLRFLRDDGLPQSLKQLQIRDCSLLEERCKEGGEGLYRPMIAHIPKIILYHTLIYQGL